MRIYIFVMMALIAFPAKGQYFFQNIRGEDGLSAKQVRCLYKDPDGFLWIGTINGLNRFDGAIVKTYPNNISHKKELVINTILPDGREKLMLATSAGVISFDRNFGTFALDPRFSLLDDQNIVTIKQDGFRRLWVLTDREIYIFQSGQLVKASAVMRGLKEIQGQQFWQSAFVWDAMRKGFWVGGSNSYFIDCISNVVYHRFYNPKGYPILGLSRVFAITLDHSGNLWYGSNETNTLYFWDSRASAVQAYNRFGDIALNDGCNYLFVDHRDRLWISTWLFAAFVKEPGKPITKIPYSQDETYSIGYGHFNSAIVDEKGDIWIGTLNGVSKYADNSPFVAIHKLPSYKFIHQTGFAQINYIQVHGQTIMACKEDGIVSYDMLSRRSRRFFVTLNAGELIRNRFIMSALSRDGTWWFAGYDGLYVLRAGDSNLRRFAWFNPQGPSKYVSFVFEDLQGKIWYQIEDDALYRYDPGSGKLDRFDGHHARYGEFKYSYIQSFTQLKNGDLLFAVHGQGLLRFDLRAQKFALVTVENPGSFYVNKTVEGLDGSLWAAVWGKGLVKLSQSGATLDSMNTGSGLSSDFIANMTVDQKGDIWAVGGEGLMVVNTASKTCNKLKLDMGKTLQDYWNYIGYTRGQIYAVMLDHVVVLAPSRFNAIQVSRPPNITGIKLFGNELGGFQHNPNIRLGPGQNYLSFQFASGRHRDIPSLLYSYQLIGFDKGWALPTRGLNATYNNLPSGDYIFKVRSTDGKGQWMRQATAVRVSIAPYWWESWWFFLLTGLFAALLSWLAYRWRLRRKQTVMMDRTMAYFMNSSYGEDSVNEICWDIARNCSAQLGFESCAVYLLDDASNMLVLKAADHAAHQTIQPSRDISEIVVGEGLIGMVALTAKPIVIADTSKDKRYIADDNQQLNSRMAVPIVSEGKVLGVIDAGRQRKDFFTEAHLRVMVAIASVSASRIAEALAQQLAYQNQIKVLELNRMLAESQLIALRAQMNPHFVFNCLNSIQECIITGKIDEGTKYLNKFSRLFRMILNNSGKSLIGLEEEREVLSLYLELESMRFGHSFDYQINCSEELKNSDILIPSMLLQPYVENALWHGLLHKPSDRQLVVSFELASEEVLICKIEDNGIGRARSMQIKQNANNTKKYESKGLQISRDRLNLIKQQGDHAEVQIIDKYDEQGTGTGTLVIIELSTELEQ